MQQVFGLPRHVTRSAALKHWRRARFQYILRNQTASHGTQTTTPSQFRADCACNPCEPVVVFAPVRYLTP